MARLGTAASRGAAVASSKVVGVIMGAIIIETVAGAITSKATVGVATSKDNMGAAISKVLAQILAGAAGKISVTGTR